MFPFAEDTYTKDSDQTFVLPLKLDFILYEIILGDQNREFFSSEV